MSSVPVRSARKRKGASMSDEFQYEGSYVVRPGLVVDVNLSDRRRPKLARVLEKVAGFRKWWRVLLLSDQTECQIELPPNQMGTMWGIAEPGGGARGAGGASDGGQKPGRRVGEGQSPIGGGAGPAEGGRPSGAREKLPRDQVSCSEESSEEQEGICVDDDGEAEGPYTLLTISARDTPSPSGDQGLVAKARKSCRRCKHVSCTCKGSMQQRRPAPATGGEADGRGAQTSDSVDASGAPVGSTQKGASPEATGLRAAEEVQMRAGDGRGEVATVEHEDGSSADMDTHVEPKNSPGNVTKGDMTSSSPAPRDTRAMSSCDDKDGEKAAARVRKSCKQCKKVTCTCKGGGGGSQVVKQDHNAGQQVGAGGSGEVVPEEHSPAARGSSSRFDKGDAALQSKRGSSGSPSKISHGEDAGDEADPDGHSAIAGAGAAEDSELDRSVAKGTGTGQMHNQQGHAEPPAASATGAVATPGGNRTVAQSKPLCPSLRRCTYEHCLAPLNSSRFYQIQGGSRAAGQNWSFLAGRVLCQTCYNRYCRSGSLDRNHSRPSKKQSGYTSGANPSSQGASGGGGGAVEAPGAASECYMKLLEAAGAAVTNDAAAAAAAAAAAGNGGDGTAASSEGGAVKLPETEGSGGPSSPSSSKRWQRSTQSNSQQSRQEEEEEEKEGGGQRVGAVEGRGDVGRSGSDDAGRGALDSSTLSHEERDEEKAIAKGNKSCKQCKKLACTCKGGGGGSQGGRQREANCDVEPAMEGRGAFGDACDESGGEEGGDETDDDDAGGASGVAAEDSELDRSVARGTGRGQRHSQQGHAEPPAASATGAVATPGGNRTVAQSKPLCPSLRRCTYEHCLAPLNSSRFYQIQGGSRAAGQNWSFLAGRVLCQTCYNRYCRSGSLDRNHSRPSKKQRGYTPEDLGLLQQLHQQELEAARMGGGGQPAVEEEDVDAVDDGANASAATVQQAGSSVIGVQRAEANSMLADAAANVTALAVRNMMNATAAFVAMSSAVATVNATVNAAAAASASGLSIGGMGLVAGAGTGLGAIAAGPEHAVKMEAGGDAEPRTEAADAVMTEAEGSARPSSDVGGQVATETTVQNPGSEQDVSLESARADSATTEANGGATEPKTEEAVSTAEGEEVDPQHDAAAAAAAGLLLLCASPAPEPAPAVRKGPNVPLGPIGGVPFTGGTIDLMAANYSYNRKLHRESLAADAAHLAANSPSPTAQVPSWMMPLTTASVLAGNSQNAGAGPTGDSADASGGGKSKRAGEGGVGKGKGAGEGGVGKGKGAGEGGVGKGKGKMAGASASEAASCGSKRGADGGVAAVKSRKIVPGDLSSGVVDEQKSVGEVAEVGVRRGSREKQKSQMMRESEEQGSGKGAAERGRKRSASSREIIEEDVEAGPLASPSSSSSSAAGNTWGGSSSSARDGQNAGGSDQGSQSGEERKGGGSQSRGSSQQREGKHGGGSAGRRFHRPEHNHSKTSTDILKQWFRANFASPYPSESVKIHLAKVSGLSLTQLSTWFVNERKRFLRPMREAAGLPPLRNRLGKEYTSTPPSKLRNAAQSQAGGKTKSSTSSAPTYSDEISNPKTSLDPGAVGVPDSHPQNPPSYAPLATSFSILNPPGLVSDGQPSSGAPEPGSGASQVQAEAANNALAAAGKLTLDKILAGVHSSGAQAVPDPADSAKPPANESDFDESAKDET